MLFIAACMGVAEKTPMSNGGVMSRKTQPEKSVDFTLPSSDDNKWHIIIPREQQTRFGYQRYPSINSFGNSRAVFHDVAGQLHSWLFSLEGENEDCKLLYPSSSALACALGKRLVRFFGGTLVHNCDDENEHPLTVTAGRATLPPSSHKTPSSEAWYRRQNALAEVPLLTATELHKAAGRASYGMTERCQVLHETLKAYDLHNQLERQLDKPSDQALPVRRRM